MLMCVASLAHDIAELQSLGMDLSFLLDDGSPVSPLMSEEDLELLTDEGVERHIGEIPARR